MQLLQCLTLNDVDRVDDIAERLRHLPSVGISDHRVAVNLLERHLAGQSVGEEDHSSDPEEQNVPSGLENAVRVEMLDVGSLNRVSSVPDRTRAGLTFSGQPMVEKGQRPEENHVSRTSSSCSKVYFRPLALFSASTCASSNERATIQFLSSAVCSVSPDSCVSADTAGHSRRARHPRIAAGTPGTYDPTTAVEKCTSPACRSSIGSTRQPMPWV